MAAKTKRKPIDLKPFCDTESRRYSIGEPWRVNDVVYATDGRILIEIDAKLSPNVGEPESSSRVPRAVLIFDNFRTKAKWEPCPPVKDYCANCDNRSVVVEPCNKCAGSGQCCCSCGDEHECCNCDGDGKVDGGFCEECKVEFEGHQFQSKYVRLIAALPNAKCAMDSKCEHRMYFKFNGGRGALMEVAVSAAD